ncbi:MAG: hypothetical protein KDD82_23035 [Planctomycetes bacterium]|nr:hypothetical protein [Planctomycetota bacterium]
MTGSTATWRGGLLRAGLGLWLGAAASGCVLLPTLGGPAPALAPAPSIGAPSAGRVVRGVVHCHSDLSHDAKGSIPEIAEAANACEVGFVVLNEHYRHGEPQLSAGPPPEVDGVTFVLGAELSGGGGSILGAGLPRDYDSDVARGDAQGQIDAVRAAGGLAWIGHAEEFLAWDVSGWEGLEVANLHAMTTEAPRLGTFLSGLFCPPGAFVRRLVRHAPRRVLAIWDHYGRARRVPGVGGCDAHANVRLLGPLGLTIGTYEECFRAVSTHLLLRAEGPAGVLEALREGRGYVAFEVSGSALGFRFAAFDAEGALVADLGEALPWRPGLSLRAAAPGEAELRLLRDGFLVAQGRGELRYSPRRPGVYRVEAYLDGDPFVLANPIYLRPAPGPDGD